MMTDKIETECIIPPHEVRDQDKYASLVESMSEGGWLGRPVLAYEDPGYGLRALTGSHRIAAANEAGIRIPCLVLTDLTDDEVVALRDADTIDGAVDTLTDLGAPAAALELAGLER